MNKRRCAGFTLVEILVVVGIAVLIIAVSSVAFSSARTRAFNASSISNLRQVGLSMAIYAGDCDDHLPSWQQLKSIKDPHLYADALDTWHREIPGWDAPPLVGSYAYRRGMEEFGNYVQKNPTLSSIQGQTLFVNIFLGSRVPSPFEGDACHVPGRSQLARECGEPEAVLRVRGDTSVARSRYSSQIAGFTRLMTWSSLMGEAEGDEVIIKKS